MKEAKLFLTYCLLAFAFLTLTILLSLVNNSNLSDKKEEPKEETNLKSAYDFRNENEFFHNLIFNRSTKTNQQCTGFWLNSKTTEKISLTVESLDDWGMETPPAVIKETIDKDNTVIIGHNVCDPLRNCFKPRSNFAKIIELKVGDVMEICFKGYIHKGYVLKSEPIPETYVEIMDNWTGFPTFTIFTSYGSCKDFACTSTNQRWLVVMEK
ncbi:hypothetical protein D6810_02565 [Candidatus Dojkabacteria bacterium]|uniref:Sortase n=1 Tax=Candidatus Dojkabacteria bacterium TaxID=2099670 RepID=A0A3M0YXY7_9BACT|nr:MAG: hypothetical protein D6810_02565 [Candidatus Dojkabacteria bacterium]